MENGVYQKVRKLHVFFLDKTGVIAYIVPIITWSQPPILRFSSEGFGRASDNGLTGWGDNPSCVGLMNQTRDPQISKEDEVDVSERS
jgi:hypothetical protein